MKPMPMPENVRCSVENISISKIDPPVTTHCEENIRMKILWSPIMKIFGEILNKKSFDMLAICIIDD